MTPAEILKLLTGLTILAQESITLIERVTKTLEGKVSPEELAALRTEREAALDRLKRTVAG